MGDPGWTRDASIGQTFSPNFLSCITIPVISIPQAQPPHDSITPQNRVSLRYHFFLSLFVIPGCDRFSFLQLDTSARALHNSKLGHKQLVISTSDQLCPDVDSKPSTRIVGDKTFFYIADFLVA
jgi:hypothetical protein